MLRYIKTDEGRRFDRRGVCSSMFCPGDGEDTKSSSLRPLSPLGRRMRTRLVCDINLASRSRLSNSLGSTRERSLLPPSSLEGVSLPTSGKRDVCLSCILCDSRVALSEDKFLAACRSVAFQPLSVRISYTGDGFLSLWLVLSLVWSCFSAALSNLVWQWTHRSHVRTCLSNLLVRVRVRRRYGLAQNTHRPFRPPPPPVSVAGRG